MPYVERSPSKRARMAWLVGGWIVFIGPFTVLFFMWGGPWLGLPALALALWFSYDYVTRGGFTEDIEDFVSMEGRAVGGYVEKHRKPRDTTGR